MGFWSQVTGADAVSAAVNAVLMEHLLATLNDSQRSSLRSALLPCIQRGMGGRATEDDAVELFSRSHRAAQLNLLVMTAAELGYRPAVPRVKGWFELKNPFTALPTDEIAVRRLREAEGLVWSEYQVDVRVPAAPLSLWDPLLTGELEPDPIAEVDAMLAELDFDEEHERNAQAFDDGDVELPEYLAEFRRLLLDEVRGLLKRPE